MNLDQAIPVIVVCFALRGWLRQLLPARWRLIDSSPLQDDRDSTDDDLSVDHWSQDGCSDDPGASGGCVNPATGLPMMSGGCGGYDVSGNLYGDDGSAGGIESLDVFEATDFSALDGSDSTGLFD